MADTSRMQNGLLGGALLLALSGCGSDEGGGSGPARIDVAIVASHAPFEHDDTSAGQTASDVIAGVRSLTLISEAGEPWLIVNRGTSPAIVSYDDGRRTTIGVVMKEQVVVGHYVRARMVQDWSLFSIAATLHDADGATPGTLTAMHVTSDGAIVDGEARNAGYYVHDFADGSGEKTLHASGDDAIVPVHTTTAGAEAIVEDGDWAVYFPVDLQIASGDGVLTIEVNMHEAFRWQDVAGGESLPGVYDFSPPLYEPVVQFGGNRFDATFRKR